MRLESEWPTVDSLSIAALKSLRIASWSRTKLCHLQAVRESRASSESDCRRISPARLDSTSPWLPPVPGKRAVEKKEQKVSKQARAK